MRFTAAFASLIAIALGGCAHHLDPEADLEAARTLFARNIDAIQRRDREAYLACYRQDEALVRNGPGGPATGFAGLAASTSTVAATWPDSLEASDVQLHWLGDGHVYGSYRYRVVYSGAAFEGISERTFVRRDGRWQIAVTTAFGAAALSDEGLSSVAFLTGLWVSKDGARTTEEMWTHARAGTMFGAARTIEAGRTVEWEQLRIELDGDRITLVASPSGQAITRFVLADHAPGRVVFENPEHDFPQRVTYVREGEKLRARIEGSGRSFEWIYERR